MSLTVRHLNADSTFLLVFSPEAHPEPSDLLAANGAYSVLVDPWLVGSSIVTAPWFAITKRILPSSIQHLSEMEEPDVVVVSQNKPDHCHKETLLQLRPEGKTVIAAEPGAARAIKSWNHFDPNRVHGLSRYDPRARFGNSLRLRIPPLSAHGLAGEVNIAFIPAKNYMTGLHNAFGITYLPPTHNRSLAPVSTIDLPKATRYFHMPLSPVTLPPSSPPPPISPLFVRPMSLDLPPREAAQIRPYTSGAGIGYRPRLSRSSNTASSEFLPLNEQILNQSGSHSSIGSQNTSAETMVADRSPQLNIPFDFESDASPFHFTQTLPTPPDSPSTIATSIPGPYHHRTSSIPSHHKSLSSISSHPSLSPITPARPKALSIIYAPHGLPFEDLKPYIQSHLIRLPGALPLTLLLHSFDHAQNPWYLGGNIMTGAMGGVQIARALMARCWLSAHDEAKDDQGFSVRKLKIKRLSADEVRKALWMGDGGAGLRRTGWTCDVRSLEVGKEMVVGQTRDLLAGMEGKRESRLLKFGAGPGLV